MCEPANQVQSHTKPLKVSEVLELDTGPGAPSIFMVSLSEPLAVCTGALPGSTQKQLQAPLDQLQAPLGPVWASLEPFQVLL